MKRIDFFISNPGHHPAMFLPVMRLLRASGFACRVLSLCEFRGFRSPDNRIEENGFEIEKIVRVTWRRSPAFGRQPGSGGASRLRTLARSLAWRHLLAPRLSRVLEKPTRLVVLPNDGAFPYDRICALLHATRRPFVIVQEGIRFATPAGSTDGRGGGRGYAVWGRSSRDYYVQQGTPPERIKVTGCPRFDILSTTDWTISAREARLRHGLRPRNLLFLSNPIDDLGFTSTSGKLDLFREFCLGIGEFFEDPDFGLTAKLHGRESVGAFRESIASLPYSSRITVLGTGELYPLIAASRAAMMFGSTAGLEVLLMGKPLALLEIPGFGFLHDFVQSGAARGIAWSSPIGAQVLAWLEDPRAETAASEAYLDSVVANRARASDAVAGWIQGFLERS